jgi:hypothetical protein
MPVFKTSVGWWVACAFCGGCGVWVGVRAMVARLFVLGPGGGFGSFGCRPRAREDGAAPLFTGVGGVGGGGGGLRGIGRRGCSRSGFHGWV